MNDPGFARLPQVKSTKLVQAREEVVELENGCICCTLRGDLLAEVAALARSGEFDYLVIESSGISEPLQVAQTFAFRVGEEAATPEEAAEAARLVGAGVGESLGDLARLDTCVTVVDAAHFSSNLDAFEDVDERWAPREDAPDARGVSELLVEQVEFSDVVIVNKASEVPRAHLENDVVAVIRKLNPAAEIVTADFGRVPLGKVLDTGRFDLARAQGSAGWLRSLEEESRPAASGGGEAGAPGCSGCSDPACGALPACTSSGCTHKACTDKACTDKACTDKACGALPGCTGSGCAGPGQEAGHRHGGISSFVWRSRRPLHPGRLKDFLASHFLLRVAQVERPRGSEDEEDWSSSEAGDSAPGEAAAEARRREVARKRDEVLARTRGAFGRLYRSKGFLWVTGLDSHIVEMGQAGALMSLEVSAPWFAHAGEATLPEDPAARAEFMEAWRREELPGVGEIGDRRQEVVFIGQDLAEGPLRAAWEACLATDEELGGAPLEDPLFGESREALREMEEAGEGQ